MDLDLVARLGAMTNLTHGFIYFSPYAGEEYDKLGLDPSQHYFASRAAPLGSVPASVVVATFFNFNPEIVAEAIPGAWEVAAPTDIQAARLRAAGRHLTEIEPLAPKALAEATDLAGQILDGVGYEGKPLAAANREVAEPEDPWARLWQRLTVLREWRGDAHVAVLTSAPVTAVEALVLHAATGQVAADALLVTRRWGQAAWQQAIESLAAGGLVLEDGSFTDHGEAYRSELERRTDLACAPLVSTVGEDETRRLIELLKPLRTGLLESGAFAALGGRASGRDR